MLSTILLAGAMAGAVPLQDEAAVATPVNEASPALAEASWMVGRWVGYGMGGEVEEMWSPARGGQMVGHFTYSKAGVPQFYELMLMRHDAQGGLEMLVKHFNADFTAWEDKGEWVTFKADRVEEGILRFKGLSIVGDPLGRMVATVTMRGKDGVSQVPFVLERAD
ncbi:DUF6265 family protein [Sphingomicrobium nitratireducens]|uniref:DUF6265 family protein n=1 Tax=Sphingomicrobium nitratireducens TaxID=2964666 RepID=UPI00223E932D|nr:DUF6265 family protein [Sphingomicrobium nitratireducens]